MTVDERSLLKGDAAAAAYDPGTAPADHAWQRIRAFLRDHGSAITTAEASRLGLTDNDLRGLVHRGLLERIARGVYICPGPLTTPTQRHLCAVRALLRARPQLAASHISAAVVHRLPVLRADLGHLHLTHRGQISRTRCRAAYTVHRRPFPDAFVVADGVSVVTPALAVLGTVLVAGIPSGVSAADEALRRELTTREQLEECLELMRHTPGLGAARHVVAHASPTAESAGESLARLVLIDLGYVVVPQLRIVGEDGRFVARVDFYLPELGVVVEFDGRIKYEGHDGAAALAAEKQREDGIRALGYGMARLVWADLFHPARVRAAVEQAARTATRRG